MPSVRQSTTDLTTVTHSPHSSHATHKIFRHGWKLSPQSGHNCRKLPISFLTTGSGNNEGTTMQQNLSYDFIVLSHTMFFCYVVSVGWMCMFLLVCIQTWPWYSLIWWCTSGVAHSKHVQPIHEVYFWKIQLYFTSHPDTTFHICTKMCHISYVYRVLRQNEN
jgi:hypothetical protein